MTETVLWVIGTLFVAQMFAYWLHRLLHSGKIEYLSRGHMVHHMCKYGPKMEQRSAEYKLAVSHRDSVKGIGMEWILPGLLFYSVMIGVMVLFGAPGLAIGLFVILSLVLFWTVDYIHDALHVENFWIIDTPFGNKFLRLRAIHDLHHTELNDDGRMYLNFGITNVFTDRIFRTYSNEGKPFNDRGFEMAKHHYASLLEEYKAN
jgi:sterol desaturase/sphingolipid hydroxylase (fatty acid hydroxylase superfamily)